MAKGKSILLHCSHCERDAKMELIGAGENAPEKSWYRCSRCRHAILVNVDELKATQEESKKKVDRSTAAPYAPESTYTVGDAIFHAELDDVGKIISKVRTSDGARAIVVSFEKNGERRLLESVVQEPEA